MKFFVDAQLPSALKRWLISQGFDCTHAFDLEKQDRTPDDEIVRAVTEQGRVLISKDGDFLKLHLLTGQPEKLLIVSTGNIVNRDLLACFERNFPTALRLLSTFDIVDMGRHFVSGRKTHD